MASVGEGELYVRHSYRFSLSSTPGRAPRLTRLVGPDTAQ